MLSDLEKICLICYKNDSNWSTLNFRRKIMQNKAQYDLDRKEAKISTLSSNYLDKYEYLTDENLGLKPSTID